MTRVVATTRRHRAASADYLELVMEFPIRPITSAREHATAQAILDRLIGRDDLAPGQRDYLAALVRFVQDYEQRHTMARMQTLSPIEVLKHLMEENGMSTSDLGQVLGSRGLASEVLNGKRALSKASIMKLSKRFSLAPALFLDRD